jgi:hypothetical protein
MEINIRYHMRVYFGRDDDESLVKFWADLPLEYYLPMLNDDGCEPIPFLFATLAKFVSLFGGRPST